MSEAVKPFAPPTAERADIATAAAPARAARWARLGAARPICHPARRSPHDPIAGPIVVRA
jgi:hypothetical protein